MLLVTWEYLLSILPTIFLLDSVFGVHGCECVCNLQEFLTTVGKQALFSPEIVWISVKAEEAINNLTFVSLPAHHEGKKKERQKAFQSRLCAVRNSEGGTSLVVQG